MRVRHIATGCMVVLSGALMVPEQGPPLPPPAEKQPFEWNRDGLWLHLEQRFNAARVLGCEGLDQPIAAGLRRGDSLLAPLETRQVDPNDAILDSIEYHTFELGSLVAGCLDRLPDYARFVTRTRSLVKRQSERWDMTTGKERLYRLLFGGRAALEEVMLQGPPEAVPPVVFGDDEPSATPSAQVLGVTIHSGDLLVSRGGTPTSALIAVGNDFQGNFSHVGVVHVDEHTGVATVVESREETGLRVSTVEEFLGEVTLRVMILRLRANLIPIIADPMLPHRAATLALERAERDHVPYDFAIDHRDDERMYCSEVPAWAYRQFGVRLWRDVSRISAPGTRRWLADLGVKRFDPHEPSDLEYDPQLRVVAEWRHPHALYIDHVDNVVVEAMLDGAAQGDRLTGSWYLLPYVRLLKVYSTLLNVVGSTGPVYEGMSATAAARFLTLERRHAAIKERVLALAEEFRRREGYRPPEWQLVRLAKQARGEVR